LPNAPIKKNSPKSKSRVGLAANIEIDDKQNPITKYGPMVNRNDHGLYFLTKKKYCEPPVKEGWAMGTNGAKKVRSATKAKKWIKIATRTPFTSLTKRYAFWIFIELDRNKLRFP